jgi:hypothetical protein
MGVPAALFNGKPDEEPWISACGLDEGEGQAPAGLHVHRSAGEAVARRGRIGVAERQGRCSRTLAGAV